MDDLSGLNWSSSTNTTNNKPPPMNPSGANYFGSMRPANSTPSPFPSGRNTPLSAQASGAVSAKPPPAKPPADSFSNLMNFGGVGAAKPTSKLTLLEQQQRLEAEKRKKEEERRKQAQAQFGGGFLDTLGSGSVSRTTSPGILSPGSSTGKKASDDDDLFAAFSAETKVDNASHYPPPPQKSPSPAIAPGLDLSNPSAWSQAPPPASGGFGDDDDPFGLNQLKAKAASPAPLPTNDDDDDFLGDLARPVEEVRRKQPTPQPKGSEPGKPIEASDSSSDEEQQSAPRGEMAEFDRAVAQLVDYGFTPENARRGLTESGAGLNVQAAANWLLDDAHRQSKAKAQGKDRAAAPRRGRDEGGRHDSQSRSDIRSPAGEADFSKTAAAMGNSLFKTANSLWKNGKKQVAAAVADFNQPEGDPNQPKWMRSAQVDRAQPDKRVPEATDEAMMLESGSRPHRKAGQSSQSPRPEAPRRTASPRDHSPVVSAPSSGRGTPVPRWQQQGGPALPDSRTRASKLTMADDSAASYVSPARRKKATPQPEAPPLQQEEPDLLFGSQAAKPSQSLPQRPAQPSQPSRSAQPAQAARPARPPSPKPPPRLVRQIPPITPAAVQQSTKHRLDGTAHFKRGDYGAAHSSYSSSLAAVPSSHPLAIVILTNRALTSLKNGEPKRAVEDADAALKIIGPAGGLGEQVSVVGDTGGQETRDMRDLYGKALSRKAEALEQMERWGDAHIVWSTCVKNGVGGATAISGRQRCQSALAPKPKPKPRPAAAAAAARPRPVAASAKNMEAVERLRKQNQAAAQEDDEKFALSEKVDAKIAAWRDGKRDNLRALIGSLDAVLWEGSGWKKVGLHELVMANKVKIHYMKAIAKCHPDKLPQDASTEVRLIAATVFATLNESWDKFKSENGL
ncbi:UBA/TS-N domain-containing protein [Colletotrichum orchidophilum]|uniref:UBA/TS-N domain-containing protein n=1 Tax=Colletotrichum orchidophilum TaxID=1209926 RepID=A0A1G4BK31_9PEZI|nr:UBA/TS-N domain-containing protein [Colletotrichum orchidophilum]OHF01799.1 UBA/TS-N domain-containing protein [Colletotrichum orchidophilum]